MADEPNASPARLPGQLLIFTGSSHAGKTTLIRALLDRVSRPATHVSIDEVIETLDFDPTDRWEHGLELAYERAASITTGLLAEGRLVLFESTFTYIPPDGRPGQFHLDELERLLALAGEAGAGVVLVQLVASADDVASRRQQSGRLSDDIVLKTWQQHSKRALPSAWTLTIDTSATSVAKAVDRLCEEIPDGLGLR